MTNLLEQIQEAQKLDKESNKISERVDKIKQKVWKNLEQKYEFVFNKTKLSDYNWSGYEFIHELQLILRSAMKRDLIIHVGRDTGRHYLNLTSKHGLKYPGSWRPYSFLPDRYHKDRIVELKDENLINGDYETINFSSLRNNKNIFPEKLDKFFYFLKKTLYLYDEGKKVEMELKDGESLRDLSKYSSMEDVEAFLKKEDAFKNSYDLYSENLQSFKIKQDALLKELKEFNKPFELFLELKKG